MLKVYVYEKCDTCRKALKFLRESEIAHKTVPIRETPPTRAELITMLRAQSGELRKLFNTSGRDYKEMGLSSKLPSLSDQEAVDLLASNGNLVKRPFAIDRDIHLVGFKEDAWREQLL